MTVINSPVLAQITSLTKNRKQEYRDNYFPRTEAQDTVLIVFDLKNNATKVTRKIQKVGNYELEYVGFNRTYPDKNSYVFLEFFHNAGPTWGHEEYLVNKADLKNVEIIYDDNEDFIFWFENTGRLMEKTLILVSKQDWSSDKLQLKGRGVQINTFGSCDDIVD